MNTDHLLEYLARSLHTCVQVYSSEGTCLQKICRRLDLEELPQEEILKVLLETASPEFPIIQTNRDAAAYAAALAQNRLYIIGPVRLDSGSVCRYCSIKEIYPPEFLLSLHHLSTLDLLKEILLLHNLFGSHPRSIEEAAQYNCLKPNVQYEIQKKFVDIIFQNQENSSRHNPYDQEIREVASIRNGDPEALKRSWAEDYIGHLGILAKTPLRSNQNMAIVLVTLASRAAMESGVMPEIAYSLSDSYINKIEDAKNPEGALQLGRQAEYQYTMLVKEIREARAKADRNIPDSRINQCKDYIFSHLHEKISTSDIAAALYMNVNYLSTLFRQSEGITISEYILQEKIKLVKNMLIYSRYSFSQIATYLGFCSQSHLGAKFKKAVGITMHQYRERYGKKEFETAPDKAAH